VDFSLTFGVTFTEPPELASLTCSIVDVVLFVKW